MSDDIDIRVRYDHRLASVKTEVEFNWPALGEHFMRANSEQQAEFLIGWGAEADALGYLAEDRQYMYIAEGIPNEHIRLSLSDRLRRLADWLDPTVEK